MILVIDVGNTRLKWAWLTGAGLSDQQAVVHRGLEPDTWIAALLESGQCAERVLVSNVAGAPMAKALAGLEQQLRVGIEFVTAAPQFQGLTNGYLDPSLLGADRWLGLIGAWSMTHAAFCVLDAGTAVKFDSVDDGGRHLGGLIVPGIHMMRDALMNKTGGIARAAMQSTPSMAGILANNTVGAVSHGAMFALAGMADSALDVVERSTGIKPRVFITGGDAQMLTGTLRARGELVPDLVLRGLAAVARQRTVD